MVAVNDQAERARAEATRLRRRSRELRRDGAVLRREHRRRMLQCLRMVVSRRTDAHTFRTAWSALEWSQPHGEFDDLLEALPGPHFPSAR
jgi:hypothetical protein